ncbi:hypothetical protein SGRI78S_02675 [Streptomyces griseus subsp. griseus]
MSSSPVTFIRSWSLPAESRSAMPAAIRTGVTTCRTTNQAMAPSSTTTNSPAVARVVLTSVRDSSSCVSGKR